MGTLKPGATYIYERNGDTVYAREIGANPSTRQVIGYGYDPVSGHTCDSRTSDGRPLHDHIRESKLWGDIHRASKDNPALQKALEQCIIVYKLTKDYEDRYGSKT